MSSCDFEITLSLSLSRIALFWIADSMTYYNNGKQQEAAELAKIRETEAESCSMKEAHLLQRQNNELNALRKRIERGRIEIEKQRKGELERFFF